MLLSYAKIQHMELTTKSTINTSMCFRWSFVFLPLRTCHWGTRQQIRIKYWININVAHSWKQIVIIVLDCGLARPSSIFLCLSPQEQRGLLIGNIVVVVFYWHIRVWVSRLTSHIQGKNKYIVIQTHLKRSGTKTVGSWRLATQSSIPLEL